MTHMPIDPAYLAPEDADLPGIQIEDLARIALNPSDILLVRIKDRLSSAHMERIRETIQSEITKHFPGATVLVSSGDVDFAVLAKEAT